MTNLWDESKIRRPKAFAISMGATVILTAVTSIVTFTNYSINAQMTGDSWWLGWEYDFRCKGSSAEDDN